jgi:hypothetical protein
LKTEAPDTCLPVDEESAWLRYRNCLENNLRESAKSADDCVLYFFLSTISIWLIMIMTGTTDLRAFSSMIKILQMNFKLVVVSI